MHGDHSPHLRVTRIGARRIARTVSIHRPSSHRRRRERRRSKDTSGKGAPTSRRRSPRWSRSVERRAPLLPPEKSLDRHGVRARERARTSNGSVHTSDEAPGTFRKSRLDRLRHEPADDRDPYQSCSFRLELSGVTTTPDSGSYCVCQSEPPRKWMAQGSSRPRARNQRRSSSTFVLGQNKRTACARVCASLVFPEGRSAFRQSAKDPSRRE